MDIYEELAGLLNKSLEDIGYSNIDINRITAKRLVYAVIYQADDSAISEIVFGGHVSQGVSSSIKMMIAKNLINRVEKETSKDKE